MKEVSEACLEQCYMFGEGNQNADACRNFCRLLKPNPDMSSDKVSGYLLLIAALSLESENLNASLHPDEQAPSGPQFDESFSEGR